MALVDTSDMNGLAAAVKAALPHELEVFNAALADSGLALKSIEGLVPVVQQDLAAVSATLTAFDALIAQGKATLTQFAETKSLTVTVTLNQ